MLFTSLANIALESAQGWIVWV